MLLLVLFVGIAQSVPDLKKHEYQQFVKENTNAFIMFYAPWCGHCKNFKPTFMKVGKDVVSAGLNAKLALVDCTTETETCQKLDIGGYPTIQYIKNGVTEQTYDGPRENEPFFDWISDISRPSITELTEIAEYSAAQDSNLSRVLGFFCGYKSLLAEFMDVSHSKWGKLVSFYYIQTEHVCSFANRETAIVFYRDDLYKTNLEPSEYVYSSGEGIEEWMNTCILGICGHKSRKTRHLFEMPVLTAYFPVDFVNNRKLTNYYRNRMIKAMTHLSGGLSCSFGDIGEFRNELSLPDESSVAVLIHTTEGTKYLMSGVFSEIAVSKFAADFLAGSLKPHVKSQPIPESDVPGLDEVVALNFEQVVNQHKDVLIELYAPWCGHCKKVSPIYEELATKLKDQDSVVIARMDATSNDVPSLYQVTGFPTFFYKPKNDPGNPVKYQGDRELPSFLSFLKEQSTDGLLNIGSDEL